MKVAGCDMSRSMHLCLFSWKGISILKELPNKQIYFFHLDKANSEIKHVHMKTYHRLEGRQSIQYTRSMWSQNCMSKYSASNQQFWLLWTEQWNNWWLYLIWASRVGNKTTFLINNKANIVWSPFNCVYGMMWNQTPYKPTKYILWFTSLTPCSKPFY